MEDARGSGPIRPLFYLPLVLVIVVPFLAWDGGSLYPYFDVKTLTLCLGLALAGGSWAFSPRAVGARVFLIWLDLIWLAWLCWSALSLVFLPDPRIGSPDLLFRCAVALAYPVFRWFPFGDDALMKVVAWTIVAVVQVQILAVAVQWIESMRAGLPLFDNSRLVGTIGYHTFLAAFLVCSLPLFAIAWQACGVWGRRYLIALGAQCLLALVILQSRAAWLALALILAMAVVFRRSVKISRRALLVGALAAIIPLLLCAAIMFLTRSKPGGMWTRTVQDVYASRITGRRMIWMASEKMVEEHPLRGLGIGGFYYNYIPAQGAVISSLPPKRFFPIREMVIWAHDEYLQEFIETGPVGLLLLVILIGGAGWSAFRRAEGRIEPVAVGLGLLGWCTVALFDFPLHRPCGALLLFILLALAVRLGFGHGKRIPLNARFVSLGILVLALALSAPAATRFMSLRFLRKALSAPAGTAADMRESWLRRSVALSLRPGQAQAALGALLCEQGETKEGLSLLTVSTRTFRDGLVYENIGKAYLKLDERAQAEGAYGSAMASGLHYLKDAAIICRLQWESENRDEVLQRLRSLHHLAPANPDIALVLGGILYGQGCASESAAVLQPALKKRNSKVANLYAAGEIRMGHLETARKALNDALRADPSYAPAWTNLGAVSLALGRYGEARTSFEKAMSLDPSNKLARAYLQQMAEGSLDKETKQP